MARSADPATARQPGHMPLPRWRTWWRSAGSALRRVIGAPDYDRYLRHVHERHVGTVPLSRADFERQRLEGRYSTPGSRCC